MFPSRPPSRKAPSTALNPPVGHTSGLNEEGHVDGLTVWKRNQAATTRTIDVSTTAIGGAACGPSLVWCELGGTAAWAGGGAGSTGSGSLTAHGVQTRWPMTAPATSPASPI